MDKSDWKEKGSVFLHFVYWWLIYSVLFLVFDFILNDVFGNQDFFNVRFLHFLLYGLCFSLASRIIYGLLYDKKIYIDSGVFFFWAFAYGLPLWFLDYLRNLIVDRTQLILLNNIFYNALFMGIGLFFIIKVIQKIDFNISSGHRRFRAPSQIFTAIILMIAGILCLRFSNLVFIEWFNWAEGLAWSMLIGLGFIVAGFLVLLAWWRNNVSMFTTRHTVNWN